MNSLVLKLNYIFKKIMIYITTNIENKNLNYFYCILSDFEVFMLRGRKKN